MHIQKVNKYASKNEKSIKWYKWVIGNCLDLIEYAILHVLLKGLFRLLFIETDDI